MKLVGTLLLLVLAAAATIALWQASAQTFPVPSSPKLTAERLRDPGWWPTKPDATRKDNAGTAACAECHAEEALTQQRSSMARAASRAAETEVLRSNADLSLALPPFLTDIRTNRKGSTYTAGRGGEALGGQVSWTMGDGVLGQTFILESAGRLFESQLSYYPAIGALDLTPGHMPGSPRDLENAFGKPLGAEESRQCFACHTTASSTRGQLDEQHATPGVTCEACHGPGASHVTAMRQGRIEDGKAAILQPGNFDPVKLIDYCGACHRAPLDVSALGGSSSINVRFQPYRLAKSRCWSRPDRRIDCIACHDPHTPLATLASSYDAKCLACHAAKVATSADALAGVSSGGEQSACPVASTMCVSCHMPKYTVPQMHGSFTDHDIRIVRPGAPFPL